ncbi:molybdopterin-containing oxidoreductase family protein [Desulfitobacterium hafniense]|nr:molybdopterin-dependent oxidoreductase [Desulfitobacterium hafniense]
MSLDHELTDRMVFIAPYPLTKLSILQILSSLPIRLQIVEKFDGIPAIGKETALILVDLFSFDRSYQDLFSTLRSLAPQAVLLALLDSDSDSLRSSVLLAGADMVINVNRADMELPPAVRRAILWTHSLADERDTDYTREVKSMEQKDESILKRKFPRRTFLKGSATAAILVGATAASTGGVMTALAPKTASAASETGAEEHTAHAVCHFNGCYGCSLDVLVRDGNVVRTKARKLPGEGDISRGLCARGSSWAHQVVSPKRIKYPMKRAGERGEDKWEQITWDEAISTICTKIKEYQEKYGKNSVASLDDGTMLVNPKWSYTRLKNVAEICNVNKATDQAFGPAIMHNVGEFFFYSRHDEKVIRNSKTFVAWGTNIAESWHQQWKYVADAIENGAKFVAVDPNFNTQASKANLHVKVRPGTDAALAMAMIKYLDDQKMTADAYLQQRTVAPFLVKEDGRFLRKSDVDKGTAAAVAKATAAAAAAGPAAVAAAAAASDDYVVWDRQTNAYGFASEVKDPEIRKGTFEVVGQKVMTAYDKLLERVAPFSLKQAEEICDVPEATIKEFAELLATNGPAEIMTGFAIDHYNNGLGGLTAVNALRMVTGMIGWPGVSYYQNSSGFTATETNHPVMSGEIAPFMFKDLLETGKYEMPGAKKEQQLKAWLIFGGNPVSQQPDHKYMVECMKKIEFIATANIEFCDTTKYADIVLPVCTPMEVPDVIVNTMCLMYADQATTPRFESKSDFEICKLIAEGLGLGQWFNFDIDHVLRALIDTPQFQGAGLTFDKVQEEKTIRLVQPEMQMLMTSTGRLQFYVENYYPFVNYGQTFDMEKVRLPYFEPPTEAWPVTAGGYAKNSLADKYPLIYYTGVRRFRVHTSLGNAPVLRELEGSEPLVRMNPVDASKRGIKEGDHVRIFNDRGHVVAKAVFSAGVRPGMVDMDRGWQEHQTISGHYNDLTSMTREWAVANNAFYDALCEVEKA